MGFKKFKAGGSGSGVNHSRFITLVESAKYETNNFSTCYYSFRILLMDSGLVFWANPDLEKTQIQNTTVKTIYLLQYRYSTTMIPVPF